MINQLQHNLTKQLFVSFFYFLKHFFQCTSSCYHCSKPTEAEARGFLKKIVNYMKCLKRKKSKAMNFLNWNFFFFFFFFFFLMHLLYAEQLVLLSDKYFPPIFSAYQPQFYTVTLRQRKQQKNVAHQSARTFIRTKCFQWQHPQLEWRSIQLTCLPSKCCNR